MNNIEFIEKEIENLKSLLELDDVLCEITDNDYKYYTKQLQILQQIKSELKVLQILTKCIRVSTISYDDNDVSKTAYDYSLETYELTIEEFNTLDNYCKALGWFDE